MSSEPEKHIHIISFDIPFPADYGGVIDVYYKIKALKKEGIKVHLHCFEYGRQYSAELEKLCYSVNYYRRRRGVGHLFSKIPYIVSTRTDEKLLDEIMKDSYPILFEGLHTTSLLIHKNLKNRLKFVRTHNIEHDYYYHLSQSTKNLFKKWYYNSESRKLKLYEQVLNKAEYILAISKSDEQKLHSLYKNVHFFPAFHPNDQIISKTGKGNYILYHGNLSVAENEKAALYLINNVFSNLNTKCIIAGKCPGKLLINSILKYPHIELIANPDQTTMKCIIQEAHINILPTFQATGIKLKLLESIAIGRFCIVNEAMIKNTGLESLTVSCNTTSEFLSNIDELLKLEFTQIDIEKRKSIYSKHFSNQANIKLLSNLIN